MYCNLTRARRHRQRGWRCRHHVNAQHGEADRRRLGAHGSSRHTTEPSETEMRA